MCWFIFRLEEEEMQKQKIQLEKVQVEAKLKKVEEDLVQVEDANAKVCPSAHLTISRSSSMLLSHVFQLFFNSSS